MSSSSSSVVDFKKLNGYFAPSLLPFRAHNPNSMHACQIQQKSKIRKQQQQQQQNKKKQMLIMVMFFSTPSDDDADDVMIPRYAVEY